MTTIRERLAALPKSAKIAGGLAGAAVVAIGGWALWPKKKRRGHTDAAAPGAIVPAHGVQARCHPLSVLLVRPPHHHHRNPETDLAVRRDIARLLEDVRRAKRGEPPLAGMKKKWDTWTYLVIKPDESKWTVWKASVDDSDTGTMDKKAISETSPNAGILRTRFENQAGGGTQVTVQAGDIIIGNVAASNEDIAKLSFELGAYVAEALMARGIVVQMPDVPKSSAITDSMTEEAGEAAFQTLASAANSPLNAEGMGALNDIKTSSGVKFWAEPSAIEAIAAEVADINARKAAP